MPFLPIIKAGTNHDGESGKRKGDQDVTERVVIRHERQYFNLHIGQHVFNARDAKLTGTAQTAILEIIPNIETKAECSIVLKRCQTVVGISKRSIFNTAANFKSIDCITSTKTIAGRTVRWCKT